MKKAKSSVLKTAASQGKKKPARIKQKIAPHGTCAFTWPGRRPNQSPLFANLKKICEEHLQGQYLIEVIDLIIQPHLAQNDQIVALPTLVRKLPEPIKRIIGDLSSAERIVVGMEIAPMRK